MTSPSDLSSRTVNISGVVPQRLFPSSSAERADRSGNEGGFPGLFPDDGGPGIVDILDLIIWPVFAEFQAACAKGVRFDDIDAALDVFAMDRFNESGVAQAELIKAGV